jgi:polar amino acid transport system substrate-binding protein
MPILSTGKLLSLLGVADLAIEQIEKVAGGRFTKKFSRLKQKQGIVVRKNAPELLAAINAFLTKEKQSDDLAKEYETWMKAPLPEFVAEVSQ